MIRNRLSEAGDGVPEGQSRRFFSRDVSSDEDGDDDNWDCYDWGVDLTFIDDVLLGQLRDFAREFGDDFGNEDSDLSVSDEHDEDVDSDSIDDDWQGRSLVEGAF
jgi:hypothetical protein